LSRNLDAIRALEDAGASAIVMYSLFEEEITQAQLADDYFQAQGSESFAEAVEYFPKGGPYTHDADEYHAHLERVKQAVGIPVIGSLNGVSTRGWTEHARKMEQAGADAIELNLYFLPTNLDHSAEDVEGLYLETLKQVRSQVKVPVAVKLSPYFTAFGHTARRFVEAGADGLVLFNRFYQPDIDLEKLEVTPNLYLSTPVEARLAMRWVAILRGRVGADLSASSGVHTAQDVVKLLMCGADSVQVCSALLRHGPQHLKTILTDLERWGEEHEYESVEQMKGSMSHSSTPHPMLFERVNYMKTLQSWK
jgi:dihydroorotate dehydrogenase (fumarate)